MPDGPVIEGAGAGAAPEPESAGEPAKTERRFDPGPTGPIALLNDIELEATLQFGSREMALREVLELGPGDVVELDRHISEPVDLVVGDRIVARGEVVVASGNFALRITEVATPQLRLESIRCLF
jgi:flagellar motor switch protein FliN/FliY